MRFIVQIEMYEWGADLRDAKANAERKCKDLNDTFDCEAKIMKIWDAPFGKVPVEITPQEEKRRDDLAEQIREQDLHNENKD